MTLGYLIKTLVLPSMESGSPLHIAHYMQCFGTKKLRNTKTCQRKSFIKPGKLLFLRVDKTSFHQRDLFKCATTWNFCWHVWWDWDFYFAGAELIAKIFLPKAFVCVHYILSFDLTYLFRGVTDLNYNTYSSTSLFIICVFIECDDFYFLLYLGILAVLQSSLTPNICSNDCYNSHDLVINIFRKTGNILKMWM